MDYCKITTTKQAQMMPNPVRVVVCNPTEEKKSLIAQLDNWLECVYTEQPTYDPQTQYLTQEWNEVNGKAVQSWIINDIPVEPTEEADN